MKFHIVRNGETLSQIAFAYNLEEEELKKENKHIRYWDKLIPGTKLKIPVIPEAVDQDVEAMEPFIENYYPKLNLGSNVENNSNHEHFYELSPQENIKNNDEHSEEKIEEPEIKQTNVDPIVTEKEETKPEEIDKEEIKETKSDERPQVRPIMVPYYPVYVQYPSYVYPQYVYPVYVYPRRLY
ncbi:MAG TPA: LysM peptidoglycan-binding domain-containing protein [Acholeplasmataceae bacterium]|jgi:hypothetical protein|nr:LysM peptidoglycan-binding domain-containing protein [Acholeplasmataceae bacterium]